MWLCNWSALPDLISWGTGASHCTCAIEKCGICCHIIALLMYLNHFNEHKVKLLSLTGTQKMQTWHKKGILSPRKATSMSPIPLKNFRNMWSSRRSLGGKRKTKKKDVNVTTNGDDLKSDWLKRDVNEVEHVIKNGVDSQNLHNHFFKTLTKFSIVSGLSMQLWYNNAFKLRAVLAHHSYYMKSETYDQALKSCDWWWEIDWAKGCLPITGKLHTCKVWFDVFKWKEGYEGASEDCPQCIGRTENTVDAKVNE